MEAWGCIRKQRGRAEKKAERRKKRRVETEGWIVEGGRKNRRMKGER